MLRRTENGTWYGIADNWTMIWVPASYITKWREIKWVPADGEAL